MTVGKTKDGSELPANLGVSICLFPQQHGLQQSRQSNLPRDLQADTVERVTTEVGLMTRYLPHLGISRTIINNKGCVA